MESDTELPSSGWLPGVAIAIEAAFDAGFYLESYQDVQESDFGALEHYRLYGYREGRQPAPWFDPAWYVGQYLRAGLVIGDHVCDPFEHFCMVGNPLGLSPNRETELRTRQMAEAAFDPQAYLAVNADVAEAGADAWEHFITTGWLEGRSFAPDFDTPWYAGTYIAPVIAAHVPALPVTINTFFHHVLLGRARGNATHPSHLPPAPEPQGQLEAEPVAAAPAPPRARSDVGAELIAHAAALANQADQAHLSDEALLDASALFSSDFYRAQGGLGETRRDCIRHFLAEGARAGIEPSAEFGSAFYAKRYAALPKSLEHLQPAPDQIPLLHYLRTGRAHGFYPSAQIASLEIEVIRASGSFNGNHYFGQLKRAPKVGDPIADYAFFGHMEGFSPYPGFDGGFVRALYGPLTGEPIHAPLAFCLRNTARAWVMRSAEELGHEADALRASPLFDAGFYADLAGIDPALVDPAAHYAVHGIRSGLPGGPEFDTEFYLSRNQDIAAARVNPLLHYQNFGRAEKRAGMPNSGDLPDAARREFDPDRPTVILFSHEASRSGAPIVALNVARKLAEDHNVIVWIGLPEGALLDEFGAVAIHVQTGWGSISGMTKTLGALRERFGCAYAIVNSVVCHPAVAPLRRAGIVSVSLIHEFANYVYPAGTLSRMALFSDATVFPARMVQEACIDEMAMIGIRNLPGHLKIRPQGHNAARSGKASITAAEVRDILGLDAQNPRQRVLFGAGQVQPRKGVDLFLQAAQQLLAEGAFDWRFVWVGSGYEPATDMMTSVYLAHQIKESGLQDHLVMFDEQTSLDPFWDVTDIFFMSSRLDPFPNVALDALDRHIPVVCFKGGTGIAELEPRFPFAVRAVTFANPTAAAGAIAGFAVMPQQTAATFGGPEGDRLREALSFDSYVADIGRIAAEAQHRHDMITLTGHVLTSVPAPDVAQAVRQIPAPFRLAGFSDAESDRLTLALHLTDHPLALGVRMEPDSHLLERIPPKDGICGAAWGRAPGPPPPTEHVVHLHFSDVSLAESLFASQHWAARPLSLSSLVITASDYKVGLALHGILPPRAQLLRDTFADGVTALMHVLREPRAALGLPSGLDGTIGAQTITHCTLAPENRPGEKRRIARDVLDSLSALMSGAALEALSAQGNVAAIVPALLQDDASAAVRALCGADQPSSHAPGFAGTYRRDDLLAFHAGRFARFSTAARLSNPTERTAFAALLFAQEMAAQDRRMLTALTLH